MLALPFVRGPLPAIVLRPFSAEKQSFGSTFCYDQS